MAKGSAESRAAAEDSRAHADAPSPESAVAGAEDPPEPPGTAAPDRKLMDAVSSLLNGRPGRRPVGFGPDLLPVLQGVCGQVTQLRIEDSSSATAATGEERSCCRSLEQRVERRMEEMEERLKRHIDRRLEALEQRLERALLAALPLTHAPPGVKGARAPDWNGAHGLLNGDA